MLSRVPVAAGAVVLGAAVIALVVVLIVGGGDDKPKIPAGAVAVVDKQPISRASLSHWQSVFTRAAASGTTRPTTAQARKAAFELVAGFAWIEAEAKRQDVSVSQAQVDDALKAFYAQYKGATKEQVLAQMGGSETDLRTQQRISLLANALQGKVARKVPAPTTEQIAATYRAEPARWAHPSKRDLRVVLAATSKNAQAAQRELAGGAAFSTVSKKYSSDSQLASAGGALKGLQPGNTDPAFERAVFKAPVGQLVGPVRTSGGWIVFKVQRATPLADKTLSQASAAIKRELTAAAQGRAVNKYLSGMRDYWHERTHCTDAVSDDKDYCA
jgi:parvulin-like peptidyl-prolyl isomerase